MPLRKDELFNKFTYLCAEAEFLYHLKQTRKLVLPAMIVLASSTFYI